MVSRSMQEVADVADDDVPWLSAEQQVSWRSFLLGVSRLGDALNRVMERDAGLSLSEYEVLVRLSEAPDRTLRMSDLATSLVHSRSRLTHTVGRLERQGLVERRPCEDDRRGVNCIMTDAGYAHLVASAPGHVRAVRELLVDRLTDDEFRALGEAMSKVAPFAECADEGDAVEAGAADATAAAAAGTTARI